MEDPFTLVRVPYIYVVTFSNPVSGGMSGKGRGGGGDGGAG